MAYTKDQARAQVEALVANFRANEASLADVPEAQIEDNYIRKLFRYLNWNTDNTGLSVAEWEFVLQRTDDKGKRPDYILQLDGQQLLVMDAKKVKYDMHDPRWVTQVYAYAYSTQSMPTHRKIDFALLTDFQEFILLDCTLYAADSKAVGNFRILDWTYADYALQFDTLWELFERENMRSAAATRNSKAPAGLWAQYLSPKKVKANRIAPDKAFLAEMDDEKTGWRVRLAKDMKKHNPAAGGALITAAVQLLIDRLIFIKALSDREIEADYLSELAAQVEKAGLAAGDAGWFNACRDIFSKLNQFYNGSIFEPRPELESVTVSNKVVREVLRDLQPENSPYNFAVLPVELLGTIYERFLGRVVHATDARVRIEEKPEVRKAGGVFYTPQYIVEYIVQHTLGELLDKCKTPADAAKLKVLDPACGSGSFLLGAYAALIKWHTDWYSDKQRLTQQDREAAYYDSDGRVRLTAKLKRQILLNNLFGVDIDAQAVEVTRFSLSLKALEDTRRDELYEEVSLFKQSVLPDLRHNIKSGNSLIGPDYFTGQMMLEPDELLRVKPFDWANEFSVVMANGGFDAVVGNPPYIRIQTLQETSSEQVAHLKHRYRTAGAGNYDIYVVFVEKGLSLLGPQGCLGYILPHKFFNAKYGATLRALIAEGKHLAHVVHFGDQQVFAGATTYTTLLFLDKEGNKQFDIVKVNNLIDWRDANLVVNSSRPKAITTGTIDAAAVSAHEWNFTLGSGALLVERLRRIPTKLGDVASRIFQGLVTGADAVFILSLRGAGPNTLQVYSRATETEFEVELEITRPLLKGAEIHPYWLENPENVIIFPYKRVQDHYNLISRQEVQSRYPLTWNYLKSTRKQLEAREGGKWGVTDWWQYGRSQNIGLMGRRKLVTQVLAKRASFTLDASAEYCFVGGGNAGGYGVEIPDSSGQSYLYILALLNSRLLDWLVKQVSTPFRGGYFSYARRFIEYLPVITIDFTDPTAKARHDTMVQLVESMLALHKHRAAAQTQPEQELLQRQIEITDRQIDALVYKLYELTPAEIAIVEGAG